jgi:hypothetical protein
VQLKVQRSSRLHVGLGETGIYCDSGWHPLAVDRWNEGGLFPTPAPPEQTQVLILSLRDGVLDAVYGGQPLAQNLHLSGLGDRNTLELSTWAGDWLAFDVIEISSQPTRLYEPSVRHPIR